MLSNRSYLLKNKQKVLLFAIHHTNSHKEKNKFSSKGQINVWYIFLVSLLSVSKKVYEIWNNINLEKNHKMSQFKKKIVYQQKFFSQKSFVFVQKTFFYLVWFPLMIIKTFLTLNLLSILYNFFHTICNGTKKTWIYFLGF